MSSNRILGFDFLRGLCATGVACYHVLGWLGATQIKLYSIGLYGVYIFFILSGASIYIAYAEKIRGGYDLRRFIGLRVFRLLPLFALVVLIGPWIDYLSFDRYDNTYFQKALLNLTFAFGVGNPGQISLATGGWSLGIEFLFYLLFPTILAFMSGSFRVGVAVLMLVTGCQMVYISVQVPAAGGFSNWISYVQFAAFAAYFVAGCLVGRIVLEGPRLKIPQPVLWASFCVMASGLLLSSGSYQEAPILGMRGLLLPALSVAIVVISAGLKFPGFSAYLAVLLGNISYGLYLLHPLAFTVLKRILPPGWSDHPLRVTILMVAVSSAVAVFVWRYFEQPVNQLGRRLLAAPRSPAQTMAASPSSANKPEAV